jgi:hypothetical protein
MGAVMAARCGTDSGYKRHLRHNEPPCPACRTAYLDAQGRYRRRRAKRSKTVEWGNEGPCRRSGCMAPAVELGLCAGHLLVYRAFLPVLTGGRPPGHKARRI